MTAKGIKVNRDEAHDLYMQIFDEFASEIGDERQQQIMDFLNHEFTSRKIDQQIVVSEVNGGADGMFWQCWATYDSISREQAEEMFDAAWTTKHPERLIKTARPSTTVAAGSCRCGCGSQTRKGKGYLPGHDARHAGAVARAILADAGPAPRLDLLDALPTQALRDKAMAQVERGNSKAFGARMGKEVSPIAAQAIDRTAGVVDGYVTGTNGRRVPAQTFVTSDGQRMNINDTDDGSGDWLDAEGYAGRSQKFWLKRFVPGPIPAPTKATPRKRAPRKPSGDGPEALKSLLTF